MAVPRPRGTPLLCQIGDCLQVANHSFNRLLSNAPGTQDGRRGAGHVDDGRFETDLRWPGIKDQGDTALQIVEEAERWWD